MDRPIPKRFGKRKDMNMKKIIKGKVYDTATAKELGIYSNGLSGRDFNYICEILYKKRTGEFFLYGEGGPMTKYAISCGTNTWSGGEQIIPLNYEAARNWAEKNLEVDEYEKIFGEIIEDNSKTQLSISISNTSAEIIRRIAAEKNITISAVVENFVKQIGN